MIWIKILNFSLKILLLVKLIDRKKHINLNSISLSYICKNLHELLMIKELRIRSTKEIINNSLITFLLFTISTNSIPFHQFRTCHIIWDISSYFRKNLSEESRWLKIRERKLLIVFINRWWNFIFYHNFTNNVGRMKRLIKGGFTSSI